MNLISATGVTKRMGGNAVLDDQRFGVETDDRIGLVGPNGCGKSTLLGLLSARLEPDEGTIARKRGLAVATVEQDPRVEPGDRLRDFLFRSESGVLSLVRDYEACLAAARSGPSRDAELAALTHRMESEGGFAVERRFLSLLAELSLPDPDAPMAELSGGMIRKAALARALASGSELVLLDEPTNHLDMDTVEWLETRLSRADFAFVLSTHDRRFLDTVCATMWDLDRGTLHVFPGGWKECLERRAEREAFAERAESRRLSVLRDELEWLARGPKARGGKDSGRKSRIADMVEAAPERRDGVEGFSLATTRLGRKVLEFRSVSKTRGGRLLFRDLDFSFSRGDRVGVVGPNGAGKTTLLELAAGLLEPDAGSVSVGETVRIGMLRQTNEDVDRGVAVLDWVRQAGERLTLADGSSVDAERLLERFGVPRDLQRKPMGAVSGGELRRLSTVRMLIASPNFLALDEPTNDFDIETVMSLETLLVSTDACALIVSHDRAFLDRVADRFLVLDGRGGAKEVTGGWEACRTALREFRLDQEAVPGAAASASAPKEDPVPGAARAKLSWSERREYEAIEGRIAELEAELAELERVFSSGDGNAIADASRRYSLATDELADALARWEELACRA